MTLTDTSPTTDVDLLALCEAADRGEALPETPPTEPPAAGSTPDQAPEVAETANPQAETEQQPTDQAPDGTPNPDQKPESKYQQAKKSQKEEARKDRTWESINKRKEEQDRRDAELIAKAQENQRIAEQLAQQAAQLRALQQQAAQPQPEPAGNTWTPERWRKLADKLEGEGKIDLAEDARAEAEKAAANPPQTQRQQPLQPPPQPAQVQIPQPGTPAFTAVWNQVTQELKALDKDLDDPNSEIRKATAQILRERPELSQRPNGIAYAYQAAQGQRVARLTAELNKANAELARLNQANALGDAPAGAVATKPKSLDDMTPAEADAYLLEQARAADRGDH